jgi:hypothetical protein
MNRMLLDEMQEVDSVPLEGRHAAWQHVVEDYSARSFTDAADKFPAISGLADALQRIFKCEYVAGLWRGNLPMDLLWRRAGEPASLKLKEKSYYAPSWSWASANFPVSYDAISLAYLGNKMGVASYLAAEILEASITPEGVGKPQRPAVGGVHPVARTVEIA